MIGTALAVNVRYMAFDASPSSVLIKDLAFPVAAGQFVSLVGPTGAGKSTLLRIIAGLERRFDGSVSLDGAPILRPSRNVQLVFQEARLLPWKRVSGNIAFALPRKTADVERRVNDAIELVGLQNRRSAWPATLSGGEESRAALARALVAPPKVLLLDEPFRNLDYLTKQVIQRRMMSVLNAAGTIAVHVSHSIEDAIRLSDVVYCLSSRPMTIVRTFQVPDRPVGDIRSTAPARLVDELTACVMSQPDEATRIGPEGTSRDPR